MDRETHSKRREQLSLKKESSHLALHHFLHFFLEAGMSAKKRLCEAVFSAEGCRPRFQQRFIGCAR